MEINMKAFRWTSALAVISLFAAGTALAEGSNPLADAVRTANDRFKDVSVAVKEGYRPIPCDSSPMGGGMGIHYVNGDYLKDGVLDIAKPEAVMYEPMPDGKLALSLEGGHTARRIVHVCSTGASLRRSPTPRQSR
jgi:hypothetical protein